jgi:creatinine amidohydrolase
MVPAHAALAPDPGYSDAQAERRLAVMTWRDVRHALARGRDRVVVPFGACEEHGSYLPLNTDTLLGDRLGLLLAEQIDALCAPTVPIGCSEHHMSRAGTLSLHPDTLTLIVLDLVRSLTRHGFRTIVLLPTHAGNAAALANAARHLQPPTGSRIVAVTDTGALAGALRRAGQGSGPALADAIAHAGQIETSLLLALAPAAVPADARRGLQAAEAAGRAYVAAFLTECINQVKAQGVPPCANA